MNQTSANKLELLQIAESVAREKLIEPELVISAMEDSLAKARQQMIAYLDTVRDLLEEITPELGVTDPASGPVIIDEQGLVTSPGGTISGKIKT